MHNIGEIIFRLRKEAGISQTEVARGILSVPKLSRLESGNGEVDKVTLTAIFQRLGKSIDKIEIAVSSKEYQMHDMKMNMISLLEAGTCINKELAEYKKDIATKQSLYMQSYYQLAAANEYIRTKNSKRTVELLVKSLEITMPDYKNINWREQLLCVQEIEIMLMILYFSKNTQSKLNRLLANVEEHYKDEEEKVKIYPKIAWMLAKCYYEQGKVEKAYKLVLSAKKLLSDNGGLVFMQKILDIEAMCLGDLGRSEELQLVHKEREAISFLYEIVGAKCIDDPIVLFLVHNEQEEIIISNELIKDMRISKNISQQELSEGICEQETLSRIECGTRMLNRNNYSMILKKLQSIRHTYYGFIESDDYYQYIRIREYKRAIARHDLAQAWEILQRVEEELDLSKTLNKQFVETSYIQLHRASEEGPEEVILELKKLLKYSMREYKGEIYRVPFRQEVVILNLMAIKLWMAKKENEAISIYEQILDRYKMSQVGLINHTIPEAIIYLNYLGMLEEVNELEKAEKIAREGIRCMLEGQRGDHAAKILANLSCVYEKKEDKLEEARKCLLTSIYLLMLYNLQTDVQVLKKSYDDKYKK